MTNRDLENILNRAYGDDVPDVADLEHLLALKDERAMQTLFEYADSVRRRFAGDEILVRGIIEFSNFCRNTCAYCGLSKSNKNLQRYRLDAPEIMAAVKSMAAMGLQTVVLQSGEDDGLDPRWLGDLIVQIKAECEIAVTLSVGERSYDDYRMWKQAGADRYLLKIETTDKTLYNRLHPGMSFDNRVECLRNLKALGYQTGCGSLVGLKGQTVRFLAEDVLFFKKEDFDMLGIGLFIPHEMTPLKDEPLGSLKLALKMIAVTRIVTKNAHLPATTAIGSVGKSDARILALKAGANVIMPNFTPQPYRRLYEIYPGKRCIDEQSEKCIGCIEQIAAAIGRSICYSRGDSVKTRTLAGAEK
jgi:biotin synthase